MIKGKKTPEDNRNAVHVWAPLGGQSGASDCPKQMLIFKGVKAEENEPGYGRGFEGQGLPGISVFIHCWLVFGLVSIAYT